MTKMKANFHWVCEQLAEQQRWRQQMNIILAEKDREIGDLKTQFAASHSERVTTPNEVTLEAQSKLKELESRIDAQVKSTWSWAFLFKEKESKQDKDATIPHMDQVINVTISEERMRKEKACNVQVRGTPITEYAIKDAAGVLAQTLGHHADGMVRAWQTKHSPNTLVIKLKSEQERVLALRHRKKLQGTKIYMDDDLTPMHVKERKAIYEAASKKGQQVIYQNGQLHYIALPPKGE